MGVERYKADLAGDLRGVAALLHDGDFSSPAGTFSGAELGAMRAGATTALALVAEVLSPRGKALEFECLEDVAEYVAKGAARLHLRERGGG